jgi:hypothetical protein
VAEGVWNEAEHELTGLAEAERCSGSVLVTRGSDTVVEISLGAEEAGGGEDHDR